MRGSLPEMVHPFSPVEAQLAAFYPAEQHPYRRLEAALDAELHPEAAVLDIGCGRTAPNLVRLIGKAKTLYGVDLVDFAIEDDRLALLKTSVAAMSQIPDCSIDLAYSRSVMEHIDDIDGAYAEVHRVLKPGGRYIFLTPNFYDYGSLIAYVVPNRWHPAIVKATEGRAEADVFPVRYRSNTKRAVRRLAAKHGFSVERLEYLNQYPSYFSFNRFLFFAGCLYGKLVERVSWLAFLQGWVFCTLAKRA